MITIRRSAERGHFNHGWLDSYHTFSFGGYRDPRHMGFRTLRVINEDRVAPGQGFGEHPHDNMEIITYVLDGELEHRDSLGHGGIIRAGEWQRMSAGRGITHSEFNPSPSAAVHLLQIWLFPNVRNIEPEYDQQALAAPLGQWRAVASPDGRAGSMTIHQDATLSIARLAAGAPLAYAFAAGRHGWLHVVRGELSLGEWSLQAGDAAAISDEGALALAATSDAEVLLFDLA